MPCISQKVSAGDLNVIFIPSGKKVEKKIYLFTDLGSPFGKDQLDVIINGLKDMEAQFVLV